MGVSSEHMRYGPPWPVATSPPGPVLRLLPGGPPPGVNPLPQSIPVRLAAGPGLFVWDMALMSKSLRAAPGESLRRVPALLTGHHITGLVAGTWVTAAIQSSRATTVMVIYLVNGGMMNRSQALGMCTGPAPARH